MSYTYHLLNFWIWWYSGGVKKLISFFESLLGATFRFFAFKKTILTLFSPWKKIVSLRRPGISGWFRHLVDNLISAIVGFFVRFLMLVICLVLTAIVLTFSIVIVVLWLLYPAVVVLYLVYYLGGLL